ncbi:ABC transporter permease subunit [Gammaproteobacteria bacterium]|nr:ABC transporter permease subunit [Gammaproteobacteria bacterium]
MAEQKSIRPYLYQLFFLYCSVLITNLVIVYYSPLSEIDGAYANGIEHTIEPINIFHFVLKVLTLNLDQSIYHHGSSLTLSFFALLSSLKVALVCMLLLLISAVGLSLLNEYLKLQWFCTILAYISALPSIIFIYIGYYCFSHLLISSHHLMPVLLIVLKSLGLYTTLISEALSCEKSSDAANFLHQLGVSSTQIQLKFALYSAFSVILFKLPLKLLKLCFSVMIFEAVLGINGFGSLLLQAILNQDLPMMSSCLILSSLLTTICMTFSNWIHQHIYATAAKPS